MIIQLITIMVHEDCNVFAHYIVINDHYDVRDHDPNEHHDVGKDQECSMEEGLERLLSRTSKRLEESSPWTISGATSNGGIKNDMVPKKTM